MKLKKTTQIEADKRRKRRRRKLNATKMFARRRNKLSLLLSVLAITFAAVSLKANAVTVQRLHVPDVLVLEAPALRAADDAPTSLARTTERRQSSADGSTTAAASQSAAPASARFECLVAYDSRVDKNLVVKWFHGGESEPIFQLIPELNKRLVAAKFRTHIVPPSVSLGNSSADFWQLVDAGFRLSRPNSRDLAGKYTCAAVSSANDDAKWKNLTVFYPPRSFHFNATRADLAVERPPSQQQSKLPLAYRHKPSLQQSPLGAPPVVDSSIPYVNVASSAPSPQQRRLRSLVKLICDIDFIYPAPEVDIFRLGEFGRVKLAKYASNVEQRVGAGEGRAPLYHAQVVSLVDEAQLAGERPVFFECAIGLSNAELSSKYADYKRTLVYKPNSLLATVQSLEQQAATAASGATHAVATVSMLFWLALVTVRQILCCSDTD